MDMDEVLEKLVTSIIDSDTESNCKKSFEGYYKNWGKLKNQEQRRKEILNTQKFHRNSKVDTFRGILNIINEDNNSDEQVFNNYKNTYRPNIYVAGFTKASYKNVLMMSEWMIEKPADFHENWTVTPCPKGVRTLIVASNGSTKFYSKFGNFRFQCSTALPGGNRGRSNNRCCILDGFHVESLKTVFIVDLLAWNSQPMTDGEADFRQFWLQSQLLEIPGLSTLTNTNRIIFKLLPKVSCSRESFDGFMSTMPHFPNHNPGLDGLLFYHKKAQYCAGQTPLVGWLYPYMVPELIKDVKIHPAYMLEVPTGYEGQADFIRRFEENHARKKEKKNNLENEDAMDTTAVPTERNDKVSQNMDTSKVQCNLSPMLSKKKKMKSKSALRNIKSSNSDDRIIKWILPAPDPTPYVNIQNYVSDGGYSLPSKGPIFNIITKVDQQHGEKRRVLANILQNTNMGNMDYKRGEGNLLPQNILSCDVSNMNVKPDAAFMPSVTFPTSKMSNIIDQRERGGMLPHDLKRSNISAKIDAGYFLSETFLTSNMIGQTNEIKKSRILPVILKNCNTRNMTDHTAGAGMLLDNPKKSDVINLDSKIKSECTFPGFMPASNNSNENGKVEEEWVFPEFYPASYKKNRENNTNAEFVSSEHLDDKANCGWAFSEFVPASQKKKPNEKSEEEWVCPEFYPASYKSNQDKKLDIPERVPAFAISSVNDKTTGGLMFPDLISPTKTIGLSELNKQGFILPHPNISSTMSNFPNATSNLNTAYQNSINAGIQRNMNNELPNTNTGYVSPEAEYTFQWSNVA